MKFHGIIYFRRNLNQEHFKRKAEKILGQILFCFLRTKHFTASTFNFFSNEVQQLLSQIEYSHGWSNNNTRLRHGLPSQLQIRSLGRWKSDRQQLLQPAADFDSRHWLFRSRCTVKTENLHMNKTKIKPTRASSESFTHEKIFSPFVHVIKWLFTKATLDSNFPCSA